MKVEKQKSKNIEKSEIKKSSSVSNKSKDEEIVLNYDCSRRYIHYYSEANGVAAQKKKIILNQNAKIDDYISYIVKRVAIIVSLLLVVILLCIEFNGNTLVRDVLFLLFVILAIGAFMLFNFFMLVKSKKNNKIGTLKANKEGIITECNDKVEKTSYSDIDLIVVTKRLVVFINNDEVATFIKKNQAPDLLNYIKKNSNVTIIENNNIGSSKNLSKSAVSSLAVMVVIMVVVGFICIHKDNNNLKKLGSYKQQITESGYDIGKFRSINRDEFVELLNRNDGKTYFVLVGDSSSCQNCQTSVEVLKKTVENYKYDLYYLDGGSIKDFADEEILSVSKYFTDPGTSFGLVPMVYVIKNQEVVDARGNLIDYDECSAFLLKNGISIYSPVK